MISTDRDVDIAVNNLPVSLCIWPSLFCNKSHPFSPENCLYQFLKNIIQKLCQILRLNESAYQFHVKQQLQVWAKPCAWLLPATYRTSTKPES